MIRKKAVGQRLLLPPTAQWIRCPDSCRNEVRNILKKILSMCMALLLMNCCAIPVYAQQSQSPEVPLYFQNDYPDQRYGNGTVATSGCGITSLAMVATAMTGYVYRPDELADYFGGYR